MPAEASIAMTTNTAAGAARSDVDQPLVGFRSAVTATLSVRNWDQAMDFYQAAFGAAELYRVPGGGVGQLSVAGATFWVAEESPAHQNFSPESLGGCSVRLLLIVEDPAAVCAQAIRAGAKEIVPVSDEHCWRLGRIVDPFGHHWEIGRPLSRDDAAPPGLKHG
jgi:PhnB protein